MAASRYFKQIAETIDVEPSPTIKAQALRKSIVTFTHLVAQQQAPGIVTVPVEDALVIAVERRTLPATNAWLDGRHIIKNECRVGTFTLVNLNVEVTQDMTSAFDSIHMHFPRSALSLISEEQGGGSVEALALPYENSTDDVVVRGLSNSVLPALEHSERANQLFTDHIAMALLAHIVQTYCGSAAAPSLLRGGLASWQVRRAKELLMAHLDGEIALEELARECGLSRSHFARAFKKTTGKPPHRWLVEQRLERAREMLLKSTLSLGEIADACGFADQSHFTRAFSASLGVTPSEWRRQRQS